MEFADPIALALAVLAVPILYLGSRRRSGAVRAFDRAFAAMQPTPRLRLARLLPLVRVLGLLLLVVALSRPRIGEANAVVPAEGVDIALSIDISSSMTTSTFAPGKTRLDVVKQVIRDFIKGRENDRIGLVVFQRDAMALSPPSLDYAALDAIVAQADTGLLPDGTGIGVGLATALNVLRDSTATSRIVILLTDGQHNADSISPSDAADLAAALHIRVYTIGVIEAKSALGRVGVDEQLLRSMAERTRQCRRRQRRRSPLSTTDYETRTSRVRREHFERFTEWRGSQRPPLPCSWAKCFSATWLRRRQHERPEFAHARILPAVVAPLITGRSGRVQRQAATSVGGVTRPRRAATLLPRSLLCRVRLWLRQHSRWGPAFGMSRTGAELMIVLDVSHSMDARRGSQRLEAAKALSTPRSTVSAATAPGLVVFAGGGRLGSRSRATSPPPTRLCPRSRRARSCEGRHERFAQSRRGTLGVRASRSRRLILLITDGDDPGADPRMSRCGSVRRASTSWSPAWGRRRRERRSTTAASGPSSTRRPRMARRRDEAERAVPGTLAAASGTIFRFEPRGAAGRRQRPAGFISTSLKAAHPDRWALPVVRWLASARLF
jgi:Ca-activated chloride channel family protein